MSKLILLSAAAALTLSSCSMIQSGVISQVVDVKGCKVKVEYLVKTDAGKQSNTLILTAQSTDCKIPLSSPLMPNLAVNLTMGNPVVLQIPSDLKNLGILDLLQILQLF